MIRALLAVAFFILSGAPGLAGEHPCAGDALKRAAMLLRFHFVMEVGDPPKKLANAPDLNLWVDNKYKALKPINAPVGKGKLDVLEVQGAIYKANYRMRFIYAQIKGSCALMGQEIIELSNPY